VIIFSFSFSLMKKKQKIKNERQLQSFSGRTAQRTPEKIAVRTVRPRPRAILVDVLFKLNELVNQNEISV
jgi:hypothetical protein